MLKDRFCTQSCTLPETGLRMAEAASNDKTGLQESMRRLFTTLGQINDGTARQSDGIAEVADAVEGLGNAIRALRMSSDEVHQTAARLGHLVGLISGQLSGREGPPCSRGKDQALLRLMP